MSKVTNARDVRAQKQLEENIKELELPALHAFTHKTGGDDELTPGDISAETPAGAQAKADQAETNANDYTDNNAQPRQGGPTSDRPSDPKNYVPYFDTDLGKPIWWSGSDWVDATGTVV